MSRLRIPAAVEGTNPAFRPFLLHGGAFASKSYYRESWFAIALGLNKLVFACAGFSGTTCHFTPAGGSHARSFSSMILTARFLASPDLASPDLTSSGLGT